MGVQERIREQVPALTGILTLISLALVFSAALGRIPSTVLPETPAWFIAAIPHVNVAISIIAIATITYGWRAIRRGDVVRHRRAMLIALTLFGTFLVLYLYRLTMIGGATEFTGPSFVYRTMYLPVLTVHITLAVLCIPLLYYVALIGLTRPVEMIQRSRHRRIGRIAVPLWLTSFALGVVVYLLLHVIF